jgi:hypothetical protein
MIRLTMNICVLILYLIAPVSLVLINDYIDRPVADAIVSGVVLLSFRLLETVAFVSIMFGLWVLMHKVAPTRQRLADFPESSVMRLLTEPRSRRSDYKMLKPPPGDDDGYCAGNSVGAAAFVTGGGFHLPVSASLFDA